MKTNKTNLSPQEARAYLQEKVLQEGIRLEQEMKIKRATEKSTYA